jgi:iduronate 2-sulfatase
MAAAGRACDELVEFVDIYPTLCELAGLSLPQHLAGKSFAPLLDDPAQPWKTMAFSQFPHGQAMGRSMRTKRYRYTEWRDMGDDSLVARELYDHDAPGGENRNLAEAPEHRDTVDGLARLLQERWR